MKCQILFSDKNIINLPSAEFGQRVLKIKQMIRQKMLSIAQDKRWYPHNIFLISP